MKMQKCDIKLMLHVFSWSLEVTKFSIAWILAEMILPSNISCTMVHVTHLKNIMATNNNV